MAYSFTDELNQLFGIEPPGGPVNIDPLAPPPKDTSDVEAMLANYLKAPQEKNPWAEGLMGFGEALATSPQKLGPALLTGVRGGAQQYYKTSKGNEAEQRKHAEDMIKTALALKGTSDKYDLATMKLQQAGDIADLKLELARDRNATYKQGVTGNLALRQKSYELATAKADQWRESTLADLKIKEAAAQNSAGKQIFDRDFEIRNHLVKLRESLGLNQPYLDDDVRAAGEQKVLEEEAKLRALYGTQVAPTVIVPTPQETAQPIPQPTPTPQPAPTGKYRKGQKAQLPDGSIVVFDGSRWLPQ